jgi:hypothetical protein
MAGCGSVLFVRFVALPHRLARPHSTLTPRSLYTIQRIESDHAVSQSILPFFAWPGYRYKAFASPLSDDGQRARFGKFVVLGE